MKLYIFPMLCVFSFAHSIALEKTIPQEPQKWNAQEYAEGNSFQEQAALQYLQESAINLENKKVLDVGCGTGNITAILAKKAKMIHGIDSSENMIEYAQTTYGAINNISFEPCSAENFVTTHHYDIVISFNCIHWIEDKQAAFEKINRALGNNGDFFGTVHTASNREPLRIQVIHEMIPMLQSDPFFKDKNIIKDMNFHYTTDEQFKSLFASTGFELISYETKTINHIIKNREELEAFQRPILMSRPTMQAMPFLARERLFKLYVDLFLTKLKQTNEGFYIYPMHSKVFHARKIAEVK